MQEDMALLQAETSPVVHGKPRAACSRPNRRTDTAVTSQGLGARSRSRINSRLGGCDVGLLACDNTSFLKIKNANKVK